MRMNLPNTKGKKLLQNKRFIKFRLNSQSFMPQVLAIDDMTFAKFCSAIPRNKRHKSLSQQTF